MISLFDCDLSSLVGQRFFISSCIAGAANKWFLIIISACCTNRSSHNKMSWKMNTNNIQHISRYPSLKVIYVNRKMRITSPNMSNTFHSHVYFVLDAATQRAQHPPVGSKYVVEVFSTCISWWIPVCYFILCLIQTQNFPCYERYILMQISKWCHQATCLDIWIFGAASSHESAPQLVDISYFTHRRSNKALLLWRHIKTRLGLSNPQLIVSSQQIRVQWGYSIHIHLMYLQAIFWEALLDNYDTFLIINRGL